MRTRVCITIDTEFSIGGAFADSARHPVAEQNVYCNVQDRSEGLGFMLDIFQRHGVQSTFFVETVQRNYFKHDPMRPIVQQVLEAGHEVELHTHPCWDIFRHDDWRERARTAKRLDDFKDRAQESSVALLEQGIATFAEWGLPRPRTFRSGNLQHDDTLYKALAQVGIPYSSNIGTAIFDSGDPEYRLYSGHHLRHGVIECPVLSFSDWSLGSKKHLKSLTIAGTSFGETRTLLEKAHAAGIRTVVILTHPFEYIHTRDHTFTQTRVHHVAQQRLRRLCAYLEQHADRFDACGLTRALDEDAPISDRNVLLDVSLLQSVPRMAEQVLYDKYGHWALSRRAATVS